MDCGGRSGEEVGEGRKKKEEKKERGEERKGRRKKEEKYYRIKGAKSADVIIEHLKCTSMLSYEYST